MPEDTRPLVLSCPAPRSLELLFAPDRRAELDARSRIVETTDDTLADLPHATLAEVRHIIGQPPLTAQ